MPKPTSRVQVGQAIHGGQAEPLGPVGSKKLSKTTANKELTELERLVLRLPKTFEEFLKAEGLKDWPHPLTSEQPIDLTKEKNDLGTYKTIYKEFEDATPSDLRAFFDLEETLNEFDKEVLKYADYLFELEPDSEESESEEEDNKSGAASNRSKTFMTESRPIPRPLHMMDKPWERPVTPTKPQPLKERRIKARIPSVLKPGKLAKKDVTKKKGASPRRKEEKRMSIVESDKVESVKKSVSECKFPGVKRNEFTELPGQLEAPQILDRITKAQKFTQGFHKFWNKIFLSEAAVAMLQDTFWWIYLEKFEKKMDKKEKEKNQSTLFNRVSDSFAALFSSVNPDSKDRVFSRYVECFAQALYSTFWEAFPDSIRHFQDDFKQYVANLSSLWVSGLKAPDGIWKTWPMEEILPKEKKDIKEKKEDEARKLTLDKPFTLALDMESFQRLIQSLGLADDDEEEEQEDENVDKTEPDPYFERATSRLTDYFEKPPTFMTDDQLKEDKQGKRYRDFWDKLDKFDQMEKRDTMDSSTTGTTEESHVMGPGVNYHRVYFKLKGRSPLIYNFLAMRHLLVKSDVGRKVQRLEVNPLLSKGLPTYRQVVRETRGEIEHRAKRYQQLWDETENHIRLIESQRRDTNRRIQQLERQLMACRGSMEIKLMSEKLLERSHNDNFLLKEDVIEAMKK